MKITIREIAKEAGVSMTTVSNVINKRSKRVSEETVERIEKIIEKYNYTPNMNARSLVQSSSKLIGLLYFSKKAEFSFADPFVSQVMANVEREAKKAGYFIFVHNITSEKDILSIQNNWKFDGFIIVGVTSRDFKAVHSVLKGPSVYIDTHLSAQDSEEIAKKDACVFVNSNDALASHTAVEYLIHNGHKEIAFLSYVFDINYTSVIEQRFKAYSSLLKQHNIPFKEENVFIDSEFDRILEQIDSITAIFVTGDLLAARLIKYLKNNDIYTPKDISVISIDNMMFADLIDPPLTTIDLDPDLKGKLAFQYLLKIIDEETIENNFIELDNRLIIRDTVRPLNN